MNDPSANSPPEKPDGPDRGRLVAEGFLRTFNAMRSELVNTLYYVLGNYEDAMDAAQDAFLKCWRTQHSLADVKNMRAWIFKVGMNAAKDLQRNAWRRRTVPMGHSAPPEIAGGDSPADELEDREALERLRVALLDLRTEEREVFLLRQNGNLTYEEIAELRDCPVGTVKTQMRTALQKLRRVLRES
jgi:RNA polymerase sigma-70 factor (ECF subfamily)